MGFLGQFSVILIVVVLSGNPLRAAETPSGLPVPRFVSLGADDINVRNGPGTEHPILWKFTRRGLPVEIIAETRHWRRIKDWKGNEGWIYAPLLDGRRHLLVQGDGSARPVALRAGPTDTARVLALARPGVIGQLDQCQGEWCLLSNREGRGWVHRSLVWGIHPNETFN